MRDSCHGGEGGGQKVIALLPGEYIVRIHGTVRWIIKSVSIEHDALTRYEFVLHQQLLYQFFFFFFFFFWGGGGG